MKKLFTLTLTGLLALAGSTLYAQNLNQTIAEARKAAMSCIRQAEPRGLRIIQTNTLEPCADGSYSGTVTFSASGKCPQSPYILCFPVFYTLAIVTVNCGISTDQVVCFEPPQQ